MTTARGPGGTYLDRLSDRIRLTRTSLCLGIDPDPRSLPSGFPDGLDGVEAFARLLLEAGVRHASAVKVNLAFFEAWGSPGIAALERLRKAAPADLPFVADAKRGDIASTSEQHAAWVFDGLGADAITVSPYVGLEGIAPLLERPGRFAYVLCRTSNPGAGEFQDLEVSTTDGDTPRPLYLHVARSVAEWDGGKGTCGLVVGATAPQQLAAARDAAPGLAFLVPGVGRQGGDLDAVLRSGPATDGRAGEVCGGALLVNVSREVASSAMDARDPAQALEAAAGGWADRLRV